MPKTNFCKDKYEIKADKIMRLVSTENQEELAKVVGTNRKTIWYRIHNMYRRWLIELMKVLEKVGYEIREIEDV